MASGVAQLVVRVVSDVKSATRGLDEVSSKSDRMRRGLSTAATASTGVLLGLGAAMFKAGDAAAEDARQQALLARTLENTTGANSEAVASVEDYVTAVSKATGVADDQLRPALGNLVRATGDVATSQTALRTALDLSAATGKDLESVTAAMGKAYGGNVGALKRLVPSLSEAAVASGDMNVVMGELADTVGGSAAVAADTAAGRMQSMKVQMDEAQEALGAGLLPVMTMFAGILTTVAGFVQRNTKVVQILVGVIAALAVVIVATNAALKVYRAAVVITTAAQWLMSTAIWATLAPVLAVVAAVALLVVGIVLLWKRSETFREIVTAVWEAVRKAAVAAAEWIVNAWNATWDALKSAASSVGDALSGPFDAAASAVEWLIGKVEDLIGWLGRIKVPDLGGLGGLDLNPFNAAAPSAAGLGTLAAPSARSAGTSAPTIIVNGAIDPEATARQIRRILQGHDRRVGLQP